MGLDLGQWDSARELFEGVLARKHEERTLYLESACASDPELRRNVLHLVTLADQDSSLLDKPALEWMLTTPLLAAGELVDSRFRIVRCLGIGGMGEVYEALDLQHPDSPERVALKIVRPVLGRLNDLSSSLRRDIQLAHRITHPNVCKVHFLDIDRRPDGDLLFLVMDFLDGETLRARVARDGPLDTDDALSIAGQIASGLDEAHREGVIHRDLKSSNIMLVPRKDGTTRAVITDFGIAVSEDEEFRPAVGSFDYMAPERLSDAGSTRSADVYAFGVVLYEMITGRLPFDPDTPLDARRRSPTPPRTLRRGLSRSWNRAIMRCLDPSPHRRFERAIAAVDSVRPRRWGWRAAALAVAAVVTLAIATPLIEQDTRNRLPVATNSVVILPFELARGAGTQTGLVDFLAEQIQKFPPLRSKWLVFSPAEARQLDVTTPIKAAGVFGATHAVAGTIVSEGALVTVEGRLIEAGTGHVVRSFTRTCPVDNEFCLQKDLLRTLVGVLDDQNASTPESTPISKEALLLYLQGIEYLRRDSFSYDIAIDFFRRASTADPSATLPQVALAEAYMLRFRDTGDAQTLEAARVLLQQVLAMHPALPELHAALGNLYRLQGHYEAAIRELLTAVHADQSNHVFLRLLADVYEASNQDAEAQAAYEQTIEMQPRYWAAYLNYGVFHYNRGRFDQAALLVERLIQWTPDHAQALAALGGIYIAMGRNVEAERVSRRSCTLKPSRACHTNVGIALQRQDRSEEAIAQYERALDFGPPTVVLLLDLGDAHAYLGRDERARDYFGHAIATAEERLRVNLQDSGLRAILAYCLVQVGEAPRARFEIEQALHHSPDDRTVRRYGVMTFEGLGQRDRALEVLRGSPKQVLEELEFSWPTEQMRQDPRYAAIAAEVRSK